MDAIKYTNLVFSKALKTTSSGFVGSLQKTTLWLFILVIGGFANYQWRMFTVPIAEARAGAMNWATETFVTVAVPAVLISVTVFLWNLWLAPYRLNAENIDSVRGELQTLKDEIHLRLVPMGARLDEAENRLRALEETSAPLLSKMALWVSAQETWNLRSGPADAYRRSLDETMRLAAIHGLNIEVQKVQYYAPGGGDSRYNPKAYSILYHRITDYLGLRGSFPIEPA